MGVPTSTHPFSLAKERRVIRRPERGAYAGAMVFSSGSIPAAGKVFVDTEHLSALRGQNLAALSPQRANRQGNLAHIGSPAASEKASSLVGSVQCWRGREGEYLANNVRWRNR